MDEVDPALVMAAGSVEASLAREAMEAAVEGKAMAAVAELRAEAADGWELQAEP